MEAWRTIDLGTRASVPQGGEWAPARTLEARVGREEVRGPGEGLSEGRGGGPRWRRLEALWGKS